MPLIIVPLLILGFVSNHIYTKAIVDKTVKNVSDNSSLIITQINGIMTNAKSIANILTINLNKVLDEDAIANQRKVSDLQLYTQITNQLSFSLIVFQDIESVAFIDEKNRVYGSNLKIEVNQEKVKNSDLLHQLKHSNGKNIWFQVHRRDYLVTDSEEPVLSMGKRIININTGAPLGYVIVNISESTLASVYEHIGSLKEGTYFITNTEGIVVSSQNSAEVLLPISDPAMREWVQESKTRSEIHVTKEGEYLLISSDVPNRDWKLVSMMPYNLLMEDTRKITNLIFLIGLICFVFALVGARLLSNVIAKPLVKLARYMKRVKEGNLDDQLEINSADEIGLLASGFNTMMGRIQGLLVNIGEEQKAKREYELALIQAQIKPHFLYNTLDVIYALSELGRTKDVQKTTKALADFYRVTLSKGRDQISLEEEFRSTRDYLSIQRIRYSDVFDFTMEIDSDILDCLIPKLTIQPLVENAIYHGLKNKGNFGQLNIIGKREGQKIFLTVMDDGAGITEERLKLIKKGLNDAQLRIGYGINSVNERIKLYFGELYGLKIESRLGYGTTVTIELPYHVENVEVAHAANNDR